jgi:hypothetical protein
VTDEIDPEELPVIACVIWDENDYDRMMRSLWENAKKALLRDGLKVPFVYANSKMAVCEDCKVKVAVGPFQQEAMAEMVTQKRRYAILCLVCATITSVQYPHSGVKSLGNPEDGH